MMRIACALQLAALVVLVIFMSAPTGPTATAFSFLGMPLLGLSMLAYAVRIARRRYRIVSMQRQGGSG